MNGKLALAQEITMVKILPFGANLRYKFLKKKINLYAGASITCNLFGEKSPIG